MRLHNDLFTSVEEVHGDFTGVGVAVRRDRAGWGQPGASAWRIEAYAWARGAASDKGM
jgi:hypothetical protein